jgi:biotin operon repressor
MRKGVELSEDASAAAAARAMDLSTCEGFEPSVAAVRKAFAFLHDAHSIAFKDIYLAYVLIALGLGTTQGSDSAAQAAKAGSGVNLLSLAEITGIPRETVRRKVRELISQGLVLQDKGGGYLLSDRMVLSRFVSKL